MAFGLESKLRSWTAGLLGKLARVRTPSKKELEEVERQKFNEFVRSKYNLADSRLAKLTEVIEYTYQTSHGFKSREDILEEEQEFSKQYKKFQEYAQFNPTNFITKAIVERVNSLYKSNNGKKSVARIFSELKENKIFSVGFGYDAVEKRYEVSINGKTQDIRDLTILQIQKQTAYSRLGASQKKYNENKISSSDREEIKKRIMHSLDFYTQKYAEDLASFGVNVHYTGFDSVLESRYNISDSNNLEQDEKYSELAMV